MRPLDWQISNMKCNRHKYVMPAMRGVGRMGDLLPENFNIYMLTKDEIMWWDIFRLDGSNIDIDDYE